MYGTPGIQDDRYKPLFRKLPDLPETKAGLLYHCTGVSDRTGMTPDVVLSIRIHRKVTYSCRVKEYIGLL